MPNDVEELLARSASTDIQVLLTAKESAKRAALDDPSQATLAALDRASKMLESAMEATKNLKNWQAVLDHVADNGRKLQQDQAVQRHQPGPFAQAARRHVPPARRAALHGQPAYGRDAGCPCPQGC